MEAVHSFETSVNFYQITPHYMPEDNTLHRLRICKNMELGIIFAPEKEVEKFVN
jgi:hypothetical protein